MCRNIDDTRCFECGSTENIHQHHIVPKSKGGTMTIPLCQSCHSKVHGEHMMNIHTLAREARRKQIEEHKKLGTQHPYRRPIGSKESIDKFLSKPKNKKILSLLQKGMTYSEIQGIVQCSPRTIRKVVKYSGVPIEKYYENRVKKERKKKQINVICVHGKYIGQIRSLEEWERILNIEQSKIMSHIKKTRYKNGINGNILKLESDSKEIFQLSFSID
jgi:hypothetical protein